MRVAIITECFLPSINGVTNSVLRMLEHLKTTGHEAVIIAPYDPKGVPGDYLGFPIVTTTSIALPWYRGFRLSATTTHHIEKLLVDFGPDVVHLAAPFALGYSGVQAATKLGLPVVALYQTDVPTYVTQYGYPAAEPIVWHHVRKLHNLATINLAPSSFTRDELIRQGISRVGVWGRGVDSARFSPAKRDPGLHKSWAPNGEKVIGYMGRLASEKRVEDLRVLAGIPDTKMVIIGDGPQRCELENLLPEATFIGMQTGDDLPRYLASVDLFVHPGELETFGQAIQEAQASGLPVIAPRRGGPIDLIDPSHDGWMYTPGDLDGLRGYAVDLLGDDFKRAAFGRSARAKTANRTWPAICEELVDHYRDSIRLGSRLPARIV